ncbi:DUF4126 family protein [Sandaracinus amylolyticus]|uniref:DUF4126 family protein n=1 Tax=Sandaracinus amylolyticus TaxID=927083 RepID=UPI001F3F5545|nr:DUF4126 family protein [Sandaracinus amylolyticus]UJR79890.1 Hypothetical protein I5071_19300 [Sandaracinus amylolyticus]
MDTETTRSFARTVMRAALLGALCGGRAATPLAQLSKHARKAEIVSDRAAWRALQRPTLRRLLRLSMWAELIADKMPGVPSRLALPSIAGRCVTGALSGATAFAADRRSMLAGALIGGAAAYAGAVITHRFRVGRDPSDSPHRVRGLVEDAFVVGGASRVARATVHAASAI